VSTKTVLITGAGSELGRVVAESLAGAGHRVFASMREPFDRQQEAANKLWSCGIHVVALDVADETSIRAAVHVVQRKAKRIDAIINNARVVTIGGGASFKPVRALEALNTNLLGPIRVAQAVLPYMLPAGEGLIVNIGLAFGGAAIPLLNTTNAGLEAITDSLRQDLASHGIDVVLVQQSIPLDPALLAAVDGHAENGATPLTQISSEPGSACTTNARGICDAVGLFMEETAGSRPYKRVVR
jgi:NAD(P)-dependent dehydrogenase (short-subunit alcohol dehydrogenase family)